MEPMPHIVLLKTSLIYLKFAAQELFKKIG
jgi:hypothetical protein